MRLLYPLFLFLFLPPLSVGLSIISVVDDLFTATVAACVLCENSDFIVVGMHTTVGYKYLMVDWVGRNYSATIVGFD